MKRLIFLTIVLTLVGCGSRPDLKLEAQKLNNSFWRVTKMTPAPLGETPGYRITVANEVESRTFMAPATNPYFMREPFTWLYTPVDQNPATEQVEDYLTPRYQGDEAWKGERP